MVGIAQTGSGKTLAVSMLFQFHNQFLLFQFRDFITLLFQFRDFITLLFKFRDFITLLFQTGFPWNF
jgi:hypothetical protein